MNEDSIRFNCSDEFRKYLDSLSPELRAKQIYHLNKHEDMFNQINRDQLEDIRRTFNGSEYNPELDYYFVDYRTTKTPSWIRIPLCTIDDVKEIIEDLDDVKDFRVQPEKYLSKLHQNIMAFDDYEPVTSEITERTFLFGGAYDEVHAHKTQVPSLQRSDEVDETKSDWVERIQKATGGGKEYGLF